MSVQSQKKNMKAIADLLSQNLSYTYDAKKQFLTKSAAFLRALGKDLGFTEMKVYTNPAGIAVSGDVTLHGMWGEGNGLYFGLTKSLCTPHLLLYRHICHIKNYYLEPNQWVDVRLFREQDYDGLCALLLSLKKPEVTACDDNSDRAA